MMITADGQRYEIVMTSNVMEDGVALELRQVSATPPKDLALVFWSEAKGGFTISADCQNLPLEVMTLFIQKAKERLGKNTEPPGAPGG
jgi:hypothetical protein